MALKKFPRRQDFVNAIQYLENFEEVLNSVKQRDRVQFFNSEHSLDKKTTYIEVLTNHGWLVVNKGDWIIEKDDGELYPCKDEVFQSLAYTNMEIPNHLPEHMKRVFVEEKQLNEKIIALVNYVKAGCPKATEEEAKMLHTQLDHMQHYQLELLNRLSLYKE